MTRQTWLRIVGRSVSRREPPAATVALSTTAPARPTAILGAPMDCVARACVVGLTRWEANGTVSGIFAPVTFAPG